MSKTEPAFNAKEWLEMDRAKRRTKGMFDRQNNKPPKYTKDPWYMDGYNFMTILTIGTDQKNTTVD